VEIVKNPAATYKHGARPTVVKMLADMGVNTVAMREFGRYLFQNRYKSI
jgi:predicted Fe-Mo cluster-binding NifX family protein